MADQDHPHGDHDHGHEHDRGVGAMLRYLRHAPGMWKSEVNTAVVARIAPKPGETVMDIGAGTGYFSFRLADAGATVIAADVDDRFLAYIAGRKKGLGLADDRLTTRKVPYDSSSLAEAEVDMVIIVNTYHHIEGRTAYFAQVKKGLKAEGELVVIDFFKKELPVGPPIEMKINEAKVQEELREAGFTTFEVNTELLENQYIIRAR